MHELFLYPDTINQISFGTPAMAKIYFDKPQIGYDQSFRFENISLRSQNDDAKIIEVLQIQARAKLMTTIQRNIGQMYLTPRIFRNQPNNDGWEWVLDQKDISNIEKARSEDFVFELIVNSVIMVEQLEKLLIVPVAGRTTITIPKSDWLRNMEELGYKSSYTLDIPDAISNDPSWNIASSNLRNARLLLRQGYTHRALEECLSVFESYIDPNDRATGAYKKEAWNGLVEKFSQQKQEGLKLMLYGVCSYLNKIGHHRETTKQDENGLIPHVPADQYEAEIMLSVTQMLVTYIERIRNNNS